MAGKGKLVTQGVKLGIKYGPQIWVATQALREPAKEAANKAISSERARRQAMAHARSLADGSILKVYKGDAAHWVVFSGDEAVGVHPETDMLLDHPRRAGRPDEADPARTTRSRRPTGPRTPPPRPCVGPSPTRSTDAAPATLLRPTQH